jgi:hypothetical protein
MENDTARKTAEERAPDSKGNLETIPLQKTMEAFSVGSEEEVPTVCHGAEPCLRWRQSER